MLTGNVIGLQKLHIKFELSKGHMSDDFRIHFGSIVFVRLDFD